MSVDLGRGWGDMSLPRQGSYGLAGPNLIGTMSVLECMDEFT